SHPQKLSIERLVHAPKLPFAWYARELPLMTQTCRLDQLSEQGQYYDSGPSIILITQVKTSC
ncbi:MAG: hypothetical protein V3T31_00780, partial [candidate division Zixibacteria bacterium]